MKNIIKRAGKYFRRKVENDVVDLNGINKDLVTTFLLKNGFLQSKTNMWYNGNTVLVFDDGVLQMNRA